MVLPMSCDMASRSWGELLVAVVLLRMTLPRGLNPAASVVLPRRLPATQKLEFVETERPPWPSIVRPPLTTIGPPPVETSVPPSG